MRTLIAAALTAALGSPLSGQEAESGQESESGQQSEPRSHTADAVAIPPGAMQPADDVVRPLDPIVPRDEATDDRVRAMSHFMTGQILEDRRDLVGALAEYEKAVALDGGSFRLLSSYVPLAYLLGRPDDATEKALAVAGTSPRGHELTRALAAVMANGGKTDEAITLLTRLANVPRVRDTRLLTLLVNRDLGAVYHATGQSAEAANRFRLVFDALEAGDPPLTADEATKILGDAGETYETFGEAFLAAEKPDLAVRAFERASAERPGSPAVHAFNLATVFRKTGQPAKALDELERYLKAQLQSKGEDAYQMLADLYAELGRTEELLPRLADLVEQDRRNPTLRFFYAGRLLDDGQLAEAKQQYEFGLGGGRDLRGLTGLLAVAREQQDGEAAFDLLLKAYPLVARTGEMTGPFAEVWEQIKADEALVDRIVDAAQGQLELGDLDELLPTYVAGRLVLDAGRVESAAAFFVAAMQMSGASRFQLAREIGEPLFENELYARAAEVWQLAVDDDGPGSDRLRPPALFFLANAQAFGGETEAGVATIRRAQELDPDTSQWFFQEAIYRAFAKELDAAEELLRAFVERYGESDEPADADLVRRAQYQLSAVYTQKGETDRGAEVLLAILEEDPDDTQANNDLGYLWADAGIKLDRAEKMIRKALAAEPDNAAYLDSLGWVLYRKGKYAEAAEPLEKAAGIEDSIDGVILEHLGDVYQKLGRPGDARATYERALEVVAEESSPDEELKRRVQRKLAGEEGPDATAGED